MLNKGDLVRVVGETSVTAKIVEIGPDETCGDNLVRYHLHVFADDAGIIFGEDLMKVLVPPYRMSVPVNSKKIQVFPLEGGVK